SHWFGQRLATPFYVAGMTAGHADAAVLNLILARACVRRGWAFGVGSQRRELEGSQQWSEEWSLRGPESVFFANFGISQVIRHAPSEAKKIIENLGASAVAIHLNGLQEILQLEGTPQFRGGLASIQRWVEELAPMPIIIKETGCGMVESSVRRLVGAGVRAIDVSGLGGTHWGRIEGARSGAESERSRAARLRFGAAQTFRNWGEATVDSTLAAVRGVGDTGVEVWSSGGIRTGLDAAKLLALGARHVGYAQPALKAALLGEEELDFWMEQQEFELRTALFCTGSPGLADLRGKATSQ
ncbi:MAG: alpha-hydroxy-acid oxidizing protein, partial [Bdellovibrionota bacterium]